MLTDNKGGRVKTRYSARKATTCKVTLSCGARIGEGHFMSVAILVSMFGDEASQS